MLPALRSSTRRYCRSSASPYLIVPSRRTSIGRPATARTSEPRLVEAFQPLLDESQETAGVGAVDETVVVAKRQGAHRTDANFIVDDDGALFDHADTENRHLRLIDERQAVEGAKDARVGDRERSALHFFRVQLLRTRAR